MPRYPDLVDNSQLQQVFLASGMTAGDLAKRVGITRKFTLRRTRRDGTPAEYVSFGGDSTAALRDLGLRPDKGKARRRIREGKALRYAKALGVDPVDVGL